MHCGAVAWPTTAKVFGGGVPPATFALPLPLIYSGGGQGVDSTPLARTLPFVPLTHWDRISLANHNATVCCGPPRRYPLVRKSGEFLFIAGSLLLAFDHCAHAYIDPGSASVVYTVALAPVLGFLAWFGRRVVRIFRRPEAEEGDQHEDSEEHPDDSHQ